MDGPPLTPSKVHLRHSPRRVHNTSDDRPTPVQSKRLHRPHGQASQPPAAVLSPSLIRPWPSRRQQLTFPPTRLQASPPLCFKPSPRITIPLLPHHHYTSLPIASPQATESSIADLPMQPRYFHHQVFKPQPTPQTPLTTVTSVSKPPNPPQSIETEESSLLPDPHP